MQKEKKMPYIKKEARRRLERSNNPTIAGELNYLFTLELIKCWSVYQRDELDIKIVKPIYKFPFHKMTNLCYKYVTSSKFNYQIINDMLGAIVGSVFEFIRRKKAVLPKQITDIMINSMYRVLIEIYKIYAQNYEEGKIKENGDVY